MADKSAQYQFLIVVSGWAGHFVTRAGGESSANVQKVYDGGALEPDLVSGRRQISNITVSRGFDVDRDDPIINTYDPKVGRWSTTISITPTDADLSVTGKTKVYQAKLSRMGQPGANANSDDPSSWEAEFTIGASN